MAQSIKLGNDTYLDWSGLAVAYEDVTLTSGTNLFNGMYYGDATPTKATRDKTVGMFVYNVLNSRPVYPIWISNTSLRIFTQVAQTTAIIRVYYKLP